MTLIAPVSWPVHDPVHDPLVQRVSGAARVEHTRDRVADLKDVRAVREVGVRITDPRDHELRAKHVDAINRFRDR